MSPREAVARVPWAFWAILLLLLVGVCSVACTPKTPPALFVEPIPPLPEVHHLEGEAFPDDCAIASVHAGEPSPIGAKASCSGHVVPSGLLAEWAAYETEVAAWRASAERQRASCERDRGYATAAYGQEWSAHSQCRADLRAAKWATIGGVAGGLVIGLLVGFGAGSL